MFTNQYLTEVAPVRKKVIRNGKVVIKMDCPDGYKNEDGKCVKITASDMREYKIAAKKRKKTMLVSGAAIKRKALVQRTKSMKKRNSINV